MDCNATQAAIRSGYSMSSARQQASRLLSNVNVQNEIAKLANARARKLELNGEYVLDELVKFQNLDIRDIFTDDFRVKPLSQWPPDWAKFVSLLKVKYSPGKEAFSEQSKDYSIEIRLPDKLKSLEMIGRHTNIRAWKIESQDKSEEIADALRDLIEKMPD